MAEAGGLERAPLEEAGHGAYCAPFCRICGSTTPYHSEQYGIVSVPAGLLDEDPGIRPTVHCFVGSKASWWEIRDTVQQFDGPLPSYGPDDQS